HADIAAAQDYAQLRFSAQEQIGSDTGELDPTDNVATDITYLTPLLSGTSPAFSLAANGTAIATGNGSGWLGGAIAFADQWQRCEVDGTSCTDIAGATGGIYTTPAADQGKTIRLKVIASNLAGSTPAATSLAAVPDTTIVSGP